MKLRRHFDENVSSPMPKEIDTELVQKTMEIIPEHTWPVVIDKLSNKIVNVMPSEYLEQLTGDPSGIEQAEKILLNFYLQSKEKREDLICDSFGFVGTETILYYLDELELDKIPKNGSTNEHDNVDV